MHAHIFAIYVETLSLASVVLSSVITLNDPIVYHRIVRVLRLQVNDSCLLFDSQYHALCTIIEVKPKSLMLRVISITPHTMLHPHIICALPILKRDDLESAINGLTQMGVSVIQLIITQKSQRLPQGTKELERLKHISIAAAEQSKNFALPAILPPVSLAELLATYSHAHTLFLHPSGMRPSSFFVRPGISDADNSFLLLVGPEGDLTVEEQDYLSASGVQFLSLTPTVLRASVAAQLGVGLLRSML